ncbi:MAG TPA: hypothetical protein VN453_04575 [Feifaniaceae bacterium]|nr:hypothetical protein [Feifaniaceae bacterium]
MGYDMAKLPRKLKKLTFAVLSYAVCFTVFNLAFVNTGPHLFPEDFALDNEERIYLSFGSGVYLVGDNGFDPVFANTSHSPAIVVSDEDTLYISLDDALTAIDLQTSLPSEGIIRFTDADSGTAKLLFDQKAETNTITDVQNGLLYRYDETLLDYRIVRETTQGNQTVYTMPRSEFALNLVVLSGYALMLILVAVSLMIIYLYEKRHPEVTAKSGAPEIEEDRLFRKWKGI